MNQLLINKIAEICYQKGVQNAILSPGSRCAPLSLAFIRHPKISTKTIADERSAGYIALGMAQHNNQPTVLVCTSGTASLNYAPAVSEAYYQQIPLIVFTADRPAEWIDQMDGQTILQYDIYGAHIKKSFELPVDLTHPDSRWFLERIISEAVNTATTLPMGPVHINAPFREPLYDTTNSNLFKITNEVKIIDQVDGELSLSENSWNKIIGEIHNFKKILVVAGQNRLDPSLTSALQSFSEKRDIPIVGDIITNLHGLRDYIKHGEMILSQDEERLNALTPDLLITFGQSVISKNIKTFPRKFKPSAHWHIQEYGYVPDTFQSLNKVIRLKPQEFFSQLSEHTLSNDRSYKLLWINSEKESRKLLDSFFSNEQQFTEFYAIHAILRHIPQNSIVHLGNSMPVRYANYIGINDPTIEIFSNRGTSGIDGTLSTAVGHALSTSKINTIILGDMAFFYDRNALWHNYMPNNLRIIILNNHGGGIFNLIEGANSLPECDEYFVTHQPLKAELSAREFNLDYTLSRSINELKTHLASFFELGKRSKILEIETDCKINTELFYKFKERLKNNYAGKD